MLRLYYHDLDHTQRKLEPYMLKCPQFKQSYMGSFHNETAYMLLSEALVDELNKQTEKKSSWKNFRPNTLIDEAREPFAEVNWSFVRIGSGDAVLKSCVPCQRCPLTTVDQEVAVMAKDGEPLKTLRKWQKNSNFVIYFCCVVTRNCFLCNCLYIGNKQASGR